MKQDKELVSILCSGNEDDLDLFLSLSETLPDTVIDEHNCGWSPLEFAAQLTANDNNRIPLLKKLVNVLDEKAQAYALIRAASEENTLKQVIVLLEAGVAPDVRGKEGETALMRAVGNNNPKVTYALLIHGADPKAQRNDGSSVSISTDGFRDSLVTLLIKSAMSENLKSPRELMIDEEIIHCFRCWLGGLTKLSTDLKSQRLYCLAIDGRYLKANTEESFSKTLLEYRLREEIRLPTDLTPQTLSPELKQEAEWEMQFDEEITLERWVTERNEENRFMNEMNDESHKEHGYHYQKPDVIRHLRFNPGDFSFVVPSHTPSSAELDFKALKEIRKHDDRTESDLLVELFMDNRSVLETLFSLTDDFIVIAPGHIY
ncbi:MAG: hypothetical protein JW982_16775 [Spirochaetes bacterium]|nr:hypothetical protein [Spirochaetota bacterium]